MIASLLLTTALTVTPAAASTNQPNAVTHTKNHVLNDSKVSLYRGRKYVKKDNALRYCIRYRESRHAYTAKSDTGKYRGAYQMNPKFAIGMAWMIQRELRQTGTPKKEALKIGAKLRATKVDKWMPYYQDFAFWLGWDKGNGRAHWAQTNYKGGC